MKKRKRKKKKMRKWTKGRQKMRRTAHE